MSFELHIDELASSYQQLTLAKASSLVDARDTWKSIVTNEWVTPSREATQSEDISTSARGLDKHFEAEAIDSTRPGWFGAIVKLIESYGYARAHNPSYAPSNAWAILNAKLLLEMIVAHDLQPSVVSQTPSSGIKIAMFHSEANVYFCYQNDERVSIKILGTPPNQASQLSIQLSDVESVSRAFQAVHDFLSKADCTLKETVRRIRRIGRYENIPTDKLALLGRIRENRAAIGPVDIDLVQEVRELRDAD